MKIPSIPYLSLFPVKDFQKQKEAIYKNLSEELSFASNQNSLSNQKKQDMVQNISEKYTDKMKNLLKKVLIIQSVIGVLCMALSVFSLYCFWHNANFIGFLSILPVYYFLFEAIFNNKFL